MSCAECNDLRRRLGNIYHLTLNGGDPYVALTAIREASSPGAPAPASSGVEEWICVECGERDVESCDGDRCCVSCGCSLHERAELLEFLRPPAPPRAEGSHA